MHFNISFVVTYMLFSGFIVKNKPFLNCVFVVLTHTHVTVYLLGLWHLKLKRLHCVQNMTYCKVQFSYLLGFMFNILLTEWYVTCT